MTMNNTTEDLVMLTCSTASDAGIFEVLARSVDRHVAPEISHTVIVPSKDLPAFRRFETDRRRIVAQEAVLPMRLFALPRQLSALSFLSSSLRRPIYLSPRLGVVRGWMIQQILKVEFTRRCAARAVMHVDSDVFFVRELSGKDIHDDQGRIRFLRIDLPEPAELHRGWVQAAAHCLGIAFDPGFATHYIDNCVLWSTEIARGMVARIEATHARPYHEVLLGQPTISEYFIYGMYADLIAGHAGLAPETVSFCKSFWPQREDEPFDLERQMAEMLPKNRALAVQSTHDFPIAARAQAFETASRRLASPET